MSKPLIRPAEPNVEIRMSAKATARGAGQILLDLGPIIAFVAAFNIVNRRDPENAIFIATAIFMAATVLAAGLAWLRTRKVPPVLIVTLVLVLAFGGLTLVLHDESLIKMKPTFVYLFYSAAIFGAMAFGQNVWKLLFGHAFVLPDRVWKVLAIRWGVFFIFMGGLNEAIRLTQTTEFWVNSRLFIGFPLVALFMLANLPITLKNVGKTE